MNDEQKYKAALQRQQLFQYKKAMFMSAVDKKNHKRAVIKFDLAQLTDRMARCAEMMRNI